MNIIVLLILAGAIAGIVNLTLHPRDGAFGIMLSAVVGSSARSLAHGC